MDTGSWSFIHDHRYSNRTFVALRTSRSTFSEVRRTSHYPVLVQVKGMMIKELLISTGFKITQALEISYVYPITTAQTHTHPHSGCRCLRERGVQLKRTDTYQRY